MNITQQTASFAKRMHNYTLFTTFLCELSDKIRMDEQTDRELTVPGNQSDFFSLQYDNNFLICTQNSFKLSQGSDRRFALLS